MKVMFRSTGRIVVVVCAALLSVGAMAGHCVAQETGVGQTGGVDNTKMGAYRALADLVYQQFQKGNYPVAVKLATILERTWDQGEGSEGPRSLGKLNEKQFEETDKLMDNFIKPIVHYNYQIPDAASVASAYKEYIKALNQVDYGPQGTAPEPPHTIHLPPDVLTTFVGRYQPVQSSGAPTAEPERVQHSHPLEISADQKELWFDMGNGDKHRLLAVSPTGFILQERPSVHVTFTKDDQGKITGMTITGFDAQSRLATKLP